MNVLCSLLLISALAQSDGPTAAPRSTEVPKLLEEAFLQRLAYKTASFRIREEYARDGWATSVSNREMKWAGDSLWCRDEGDDDGMLRYSNARTGEVPLGVAMTFLPAERVVDAKTGSIWARACNSPFTTKAASGAWFDYVDVRAIGLRSIVIQQTDPHGLLDLLRGDGGLRFETLPDRNGLTVIRGLGQPNSDDTRYEYEWEIDKNKGPSVVCARQYLTYSDGRRELSSDAKTSLIQVNGVWWPSRVEMNYIGNNGRRTFEFQKVEFNEPHHPSIIDADTLGLPIGAPVYPQGLRRTDRYMGAGITIDDETWKRIRDDYDRRPYREFSNRALALGRGQFPSWWSITDGTEGLPEVADRPDQWEVYVRRWVMRRTNNGMWRVGEPLTDVQRTTAKSILDDCRKTAMPIRMRLDKEAAEVAKDLAEAEAILVPRTVQAAIGKVAPVSGKESSATGAPQKSTGSAKEGQPPADDALVKRIAALKARKAELAKSPEIERIFEQLKGRLEGLLTAKQKDPANGRVVQGNPPPIPGMKGARPTRAPRPAPAAKP